MYFIFIITLGVIVIVSKFVLATLIIYNKFCIVETVFAVYYLVCFIITNATDNVEE